MHTQQCVCVCVSVLAGSVPVCARMGVHVRWLCYKCVQNVGYEPWKGSKVWQDGSGRCAGRNEQSLRPSRPPTPER